MVTTASGELIKKAVPPLTMWAVARMLEVPAVKKTLRKVDAKMLHTAVKKRHLVPRRLLRFGVGVFFVIAGGMMIARARRLSPA